MATKKRDRDGAEPGFDYKARANDNHVHSDDWDRAGCAADAIVKRAFKSTTDTPSDDAIFTQHVKAQLAYLNMCRVVHQAHVGDLDINASIGGEVDVNLTNKDDKAFSIVNDGSVTLEGGLDVYAGNLHGDEFLTLNRKHE